jgi:hypothetical protein
MATHYGKLPPHFPYRAVPLGFALVADFERVVDQS